MVCVQTYVISFYILTSLYVVTGHNDGQKSEAYVSGPRIFGLFGGLTWEMNFEVKIRWKYEGRRGSKHICGGSIIDSEHVLTAGHCVYGLSPADLKVIAGSLNNAEESSEDIKLVQEVTDVFLHEEFDYGSLVNDIAIIKVSPGFPIDNPAVKPIPLQKDATVSGTKCIVSSWGLRGDQAKDSPQNFQVAIVHFMTYEECHSRYTNNSERTIQPGMNCAVPIKNGSDSCDGDSGGPLQCGGLLTGVVSWGNGCASPDHPGVYTDVAYYKDWIEGKLHKSKDEL